MRILERGEAAFIDEQPLERVVWICPECFGTYDGRPASGECPSPGHASVELFSAPVRPVATSAETVITPAETGVTIAPPAIAA